MVNTLQQIRAKMARRPLNKYDSPMCPCELEAPRVVYEYNVDTPWITYDSSDEDEAIETAAAAMAMRASVYAATVESATLEMSGSADEGATAGPSSASQDGGSPAEYEYSSDEDDMIAPEPTRRSAHAGSSRMARQAEISGI
ncbi:uncharacterized protein LOC113495689 isoform X2 [Trichoplusia ni]|uniref:Uncharacterized protein LOC113495689 isoform X2 n=1 Tax=Trichoplusia ni TaxID=7111 RepID=A0A7E5VPV3_TRINI|nr:uncharacterized protein LOC113495689 isoform X2 [Trichoplusia ni]